MYLAKEEISIELPLDFSKMSVFSKKVLSTLRDIPFGHTKTYSQIAKQIEHLKAFRAVGNVCHHNPFPLVMPIVAINDTNSTPSFQTEYCFRFC